MLAESLERKTPLDTKFLMRAALISALAGFIHLVAITRAQQRVFFTSVKENGIPNRWIQELLEY